MGGRIWKQVHKQLSSIVDCVLTVKSHLFVFPSLLLFRLKFSLYFRGRNELVDSDKVIIAPWIKSRTFVSIYRILVEIHQLKIERKKEDQLSDWLLRGCIPTPRQTLVISTRCSSIIQRKAESHIKCVSTGRWWGLLLRPRQEKRREKEKTKNKNNKERMGEKKEHMQTSAVRNYFSRENDWSTSMVWHLEVHNNSISNGIRLWVCQSPFIPSIISFGARIEKIIS